MTMQHRDGNPPQHVAVTSEFTMLAQLKASGALGLTGRAKTSYTTMTTTRITKASTQGAGYGWVGLDRVVQETKATGQNLASPAAP